jgi:ribosome-associated heat shock protein Hsp15
MRLDQWLWAARIYKTRSQAAAAIRAGYVNIGGSETKPSREIQLNEIVIARAHQLTRTVRVLGKPPSRVGAKLVAQYMEDLTPPEEHERRRERNLLPPGFRQEGIGRPTKRERRDIDRLSESGD